MHILEIEPSAHVTDVLVTVLRMKHQQKQCCYKVKEPL